MVLPTKASLGIALASLKDANNEVWECHAGTWGTDEDDVRLALSAAMVHITNAIDAVKEASRRVGAARKDRMMRKRRGV